MSKLVILLGLLMAGCNSGTSNVSGNLTNSTDKVAVNNGAEATYYSLDNYTVTSTFEESGVMYVGTESGLFVSNTNGERWTLKSTNSGLSSNKITHISGHGSIIYVVAEGCINVSNDAGQTWKLLQTSYSGEYNGVSYSNGIIFLSGVSSNKATSPLSFINISSDEGKTWNQIQLGENTVKVDSIYVDNGVLYYIDTSTSMVYRTKDLGKSYSYTGLITAKGERPNLYSVAAHNNIVAVGTDHGVAVTTSTDSSWKTSTFTFFTTSNGLGSNDVKAVTIDNNGKLLAATDSGLSVSYDNGKSFVNYLPTSYNQLNSPIIKSVYANDSLIMVGTINGLSYYNNSTQLIWGLVGSTDYTSSITGDSDQTYFAGYKKGLTIINGNSVQSKTYTGTNYGLYDGYSLSTYVESNTIYVGSLGGLSISRNRGTTWVYKTYLNGITGAVNSVVASGNNIYLGTLGGGLNISHDGGETWVRKNINSNDNVINTLFIDGKNIYAGTIHRGVAVSTDNGNNWKNFILDPAGIFDGEDVSVYSIFAVGNAIYAGTDQGLYVSLDAGKTWSRKTDNLNQSVYGVYASVGNIYVALADGSKAISLDGTHFTKFSPFSRYTTSAYAIYERLGAIFVGNDYHTEYGIKK